MFPIGTDVSQTIMSLAKSTGPRAGGLQARLRKHLVEALLQTRGFSREQFVTGNRVAEWNILTTEDRPAIAIRPEIEVGSCGFP